MAKKEHKKMPKANKKKQEVKKLSKSAIIAMLDKALEGKDE